MSTNSLYGGIFPSINFGALMSGQKIPKVDGMKEADVYSRHARKCNKHIHRMYGSYKGYAFNLQRLTEV